MLAVMAVLAILAYASALRGAMQAWAEQGQPLIRVARMEALSYDDRMQQIVPFTLTGQQPTARPERPGRTRGEAGAPGRAAGAGAGLSGGEPYAGEGGATASTAMRQPPAEVNIPRLLHQNFLGGRAQLEAAALQPMSHFRKEWWRSCRVGTLEGAGWGEGCSPDGWHPAGCVRFGLQPSWVAPNWVQAFWEAKGRVACCHHKRWPCYPPPHPQQPCDSAHGPVRPQTHHPGWRHILWDAAMCEKLLAEHYPWFLPTWRAYPSTVLKSGAWPCTPRLRPGPGGGGAAGHSHEGG